MALLLQLSLLFYLIWGVCFYSSVAAWPFEHWENNLKHPARLLCMHVYSSLVKNMENMLFLKTAPTPNKVFVPFLGNSYDKF